MRKVMIEEMERIKKQSDELKALMEDVWFRCEGCGENTQDPECCEEEKS